MIYRLIYEGTTILALTEAVGSTVGPASTFDGTAAEVLSKVSELELQDPDGNLTSISQA